MEHNLKGYRGQMAWVAGDILEFIYDQAGGEMTVSQTLRVMMSLPEPAREASSILERKKSKYAYDVTGLAVGEAKTFEANVPLKSVARSVKAQQVKNGREHKIVATFSGAQVTRVR